MQRDSVVLGLALLAASGRRMLHSKKGMDEAYHMRRMYCTYIRGVPKLASRCVWVCYGESEYVKVLGGTGFDDR